MGTCLSSLFGSGLHQVYHGQQQHMAQMQAHLQFALGSQWDSAYYNQLSSITHYQPYTQPKPRRDCYTCGAPWLPTCNYCGAEH